MCTRWRLTASAIAAVGSVVFNLYITVHPLTKFIMYKQTAHRPIYGHFSHSHQVIKLCSPNSQYILHSKQKFLLIFLKKFLLGSFKEKHFLDNSTGNTSGVFPLVPSGIFSEIISGILPEIPSQITQGIDSGIPRIPLRNSMWFFSWSSFWFSEGTSR